MKKFLFLVVCVTACGPREEALPGESWEQFEEHATVVVGGQVLYRVEGDILVSHDELRAYYEAHIAPSTSPDGLGKVTQPLLVNRINSTDDIWNSTQRLNLRYCVSNSFGSLKDRVVSEMWSATAAWEGAANVRFVYDPSQDGNCDDTTQCTKDNNGGLTCVQPLPVGNSSSTFPSNPYGVILLNYGASAPSESSTAILTHEVGHRLGFRHEHIRPEAAPYPYGCSPESNSWRAVTSYDRSSVMHYPYCNGVAETLEKPYALTDLDRQGAASLYGPGSTPNGTNAIDRSEFFVRQVYRDVLKRDPDAGGSAYYLSVLQNCNGNSVCLSAKRAAIARELLESSENRQQDPELNPASSGYNSAFITHCYTNFLRRQPDAAGFNWWLNDLNSGGDYTGVVRSFITTAEYRQRFGVQ
jgi:hypothetical protein